MANNTPTDQTQAKNIEEVRAAAQDFEAMFLSQMMNYMFSSLKTDGPFGGGKGEEVFRSLMVDEYGKQIANAGGLGLSDDLTQAMLKLQEAQSQ